MDGDFGGLDGAPNDGTLGGTMTGEDGENSATMGGGISGAQADANASLGSFGMSGAPEGFGFGFGVPDSFMSQAMSNPSFTGSQGFSNPTQDESLFSKALKSVLSNKAVNTLSSKTGIPAMAFSFGKGLAKNDPQSVAHGFMNSMISAIPGFGPAIHGFNSTMNALGVPNMGMTGNSAPNANSGVSAGGMEGALGGLASLYSLNKANKNFKNYENSLSGMYGQDSPFAQQLRQQLSRRDAAAGRRSQYGPREVELQSQLAQLMSRNAGPIFQSSQARNQMNAQGLAQLFQLLNQSGITNKIGSGIQGMFNDGHSGAFDFSMGPVLDPYGAGSGWGGDTLDYFGG